MAWTDTDPVARYHTISVKSSIRARESEPPRYPMPRERSKKSARVVPAVVVATITAQYRNGWKRLAAICAATAAMNSAAKMAVPAR